MITPAQEAQITLLIYCGFATLAIILISYGWYLRLKIKRDYRQAQRREHLMDQAALRLREITLFIEELWQSNKPKR